MLDNQLPVNRTAVAVLIVVTLLNLTQKLSVLKYYFFTIKTDENDKLSESDCNNTPAELAETAQNISLNWEP